MSQSLDNAIALAHMPTAGAEDAEGGMKFKKTHAVKDLNKKRVQRSRFRGPSFSYYAGTPLIKPENLFKQTEPPLTSFITCAASSASKGWRSRPRDPAAHALGRVS